MYDLLQQRNQAERCGWDPKAATINASVSANGCVVNCWEIGDLFASVKGTRWGLTNKTSVMVSGNEF